MALTNLDIETVKKYQLTHNGLKLVYRQLDQTQIHEWVRNRQEYERMIETGAILIKAIARGNLDAIFQTLKNAYISTDYRAELGVIRGSSMGPISKASIVIALIAAKIALNFYMESAYHGEAKELWSFINTTLKTSNNPQEFWNKLKYEITFAQQLSYEFKRILRNAYQLAVNRTPKGDKILRIVQNFYKNPTYALASKASDILSDEFRTTDKMPNVESVEQERKKLYDTIIGFADKFEKAAIRSIDQETPSEQYKPLVTKLRVAVQSAVADAKKKAIVVYKSSGNNKY